VTTPLPWPQPNPGSGPESNHAVNATAASASTDFNPFDPVSVGPHPREFGFATRGEAGGFLSSPLKARRLGLGPRGADPAASPELQVAPMLDMAFQLLAFFILTFQTPSTESRIDLELPAQPQAIVAPVASGSRQPSQFPRLEDSRFDLGLDDRLILKVVADPDGRIASMSLAEGGTPVADLNDLFIRVARYAEALGEESPLTVVLRADDRLRHEEASRILERLAAAGVGSIRLEGLPANSSGDIRP